MRFLLFNAAVIAALLYLFSTSRSEFHAAADRVYDKAEGIQDMARDVVGKAEGVDQREEAFVNERFEASVDGAPEPSARDEEPQEPYHRSARANPAQEEALAAAEDSTPGGPRQAEFAAQIESAPATAVAERIGPLPTVSDPAVARRRAEVLEGNVSADPNPATTLAEDKTPMNPEERLRNLYSLAEEMELLYVSKMTR